MFDELSHRVIGGVREVHRALASAFELRLPRELIDARVGLLINFYVEILKEGIQRFVRYLRSPSSCPSCPSW